MQSPSLAAIVGYQLSRYAGVKRDMELIRRIVRHIEEREGAEACAVQFDDVPDIEVRAHVLMLWEAGYLNGTKRQPLKDPLPDIWIRTLTWEGHEFAATMQESSWGRVKEKFSPSELADMSLTVVKDVATALTIAWAKGRIGLGEG